MAPLAATADLARIEAPITFKAYLMCVFAAFGGIFFGYDSGYINGVIAMPYFITQQTGLNQATTPEKQFLLPSSRQSLIVSILSCGTFFGAIAAGDIADIVGRKWTIIAGCGIYMIGESIVFSISENRAWTNVS